MSKPRNRTLYNFLRQKFTIDTKKLVRLIICDEALLNWYKTWNHHPSLRLNFKEECPNYLLQELEERLKS